MTTDDPFVPVLLWVARVASIAAIVNALELLTIRKAWSDSGVWRAPTLRAEWGVFGALLGERAFTGLLSAQIVAGVFLAATPNAPCAALLCATTYLCALRFRGSVNGGSDAMLFTVLGGLTLALSTNAPSALREAGMLYIAAQLTLSYMRAGLVKARRVTWWNGDAMAAFLALPAYGVPSWMPRAPGLLRVAGIAVVCFELAAPLAWTNRLLCIAYIAAALCFHAATAVTFGLNRFFLAWGAALPTLWYAMLRVHR